MKALDLLFSRLLRFDLSREDLAKWVGFARQVFGAMLLLVLAAAGVSGVYSTRQSQALLRGTLNVQGRAVASALARAAYVPISLEDPKTLRALAQSFAGVEHLNRVTILDAGGKVLEQVDFPGPSGAPVAVTVPVSAPKEYDENGRGETAGSVEVVLSSESIDRAARRVAWTNLFATGLLAAVFSLVGLQMTRILVSRMQILVGEARLVEQVRQANAELEAFSYSVSHDLRAPLRTIMGFAQIIQKRGAERLDEEGRGNLTRVIDAAQRMARIIDDLLALSRVGRHELVRRRVSVSEAAKRIAERLRESAPRDDARIDVEPGLSADADQRLLDIALENLLGNAWKYTSKTRGARIAFGALDREGERVFFVKDNGAGFDPRFSNKLFQPFQRLHADSDFQGTGIGLATVRRVVQRHGGRVWAEGQPDKGAVFYFTLAPKGGR